MGPGMTRSPCAGVDRSREHRGLPLRGARSRLPQTRGGTPAAPGPVLGLWHRGERPHAFFFVALFPSTSLGRRAAVASSSGRMGARQRERERSGGPARPPPSPWRILPQPPPLSAPDPSQRGRRQGVDVEHASLSPPRSSSCCRATEGPAASIGSGAGPSLGRSGGIWRPCVRWPLPDAVV